MTSTGPTHSLAGTRSGAPNHGFTDGSATAWRGRNGKFHDTAGENSRTGKLDDAAVRDIRSRPTTGPGRQTHAAIAEEFGVSRGQVAAIRQGKAWGHVKGEP